MSHAPHDAPASHGHAAHAGAGPRTYVVIGLFLVVLTVMEVAVFYIHALAAVLVPVLIFLALAKFALVAMFYMHLRFDHPWFSYLFVGPLVVMAGLALALLWVFGVFGTTGLPPGSTG